MKKFIIGKKIGMTQIFNDEGLSIPVTVIEAGPCTVVQKKTLESDGYNAIKIGYQDVEAKKKIYKKDNPKKELRQKDALNKAESGVFSKLKLEPKKYLREMRTEEIEKYEVGQEIKIQDMFQSGDKVDVSGISKGKGFQGTIKRYGQSGGNETHGSMYHRRVGSMSANTNPARVFKGKKLPGHMGLENVTVQNLDVVRVDGDRNLLLIKGAVPGPKGGVIVIKGTVKSGK
ncbi:MAG: 50S ribosomal protein L3 [Clostridia bacterium]|nr:50S ribosomal protein L3 [Clostridia bacterium]